MGNFVALTKINFLSLNVVFKNYLLYEKNHFNDYLWIHFKKSY